VRDVILREGSTMRLSQPTRDDRDAIMALIRRLSPTSLYHRYRGRPVLDDRLIAGYLDADGDARGALIGVRDGLVVAMGTYDRLRDPEMAEVAFLVDDPCTAAALEHAFSNSSPRSRWPRASAGSSQR